VLYALVQIAVDLGFAPGWMAFTKLLEPLAVQGDLAIVVGLRPSGFFTNTTALSVFGIVCLCFFYARYVANRSPADLRYALGSLVVVLLTTSRAAFAAAVLIVAVGWLGLTAGRKFVLLAILLAVAASFLLMVEQTVGLDQAFHRFTRVVEGGLLADVSFGRRVKEIWPAALAVASDYPLGTWISAPRIAVLIDSGYLSYYMQGRWVFVAGIAVMLLGQLAIGIRCLREPHLRSGGLMILFLSIFLTLAMVISNPLRTPIVIAFLVFAFWKFKAEQESRMVSTTLRRGQSA
jgi:hypothetical protein